MENKEAIRAELQEDVYQIQDEIAWATRRLQEADLGMEELQRMADSYATRLDILKEDLKDTQLMLDGMSDNFQKNN